MKNMFPIKEYSIKDIHLNILINCLKTALKLKDMVIKKGMFLKKFKTRNHRFNQLEKCQKNQTQKKVKPINF